MTRWRAMSSFQFVDANLPRGGSGMSRQDNQLKIK
jgi:hypothetical protein